MNTNSILTLDGLALTEHNRSELSVDYEHINRTARTVQGAMRRQHVALKRSFSVSWEDLPHSSAFTVDGKPGGQQMVDFFRTRMSSALTLLVSKENKTTTESVTVLIEAFDYSVQKRWEYEFWNISVTLVEV